MTFPDEHDVTASWLAEALGRAGEELIETRRSIGTGQVGENVRYQLTWPPSTVQEPRSVVGKFPSPDATSRETAAATGAYVREIGFYRDLQATVTIRTPEIFFLGEDLLDNRFLLLMEDISAEQGDQLTGCSIGQAELAVDAIVGLHAPHWGGEQLESLTWLPARAPERGAELHAFYGMLFDGFADRYAGRLAADDVAIGRSFASRVSDWFGSFHTPITLAHGDYRLDNLLFGADHSEPAITVVDWQTATQGHGPSDVAYFIGAGLITDDRRRCESELFDRYQHGLSDRGVSVVTDDLWHDYVLGAASGYLMAVVASQIVGQTERGDEMFCVMAERHATQMRDLGTLDAIEAS